MRKSGVKKQTDTANSHISMRIENIITREGMRKIYLVVSFIQKLSLIRTTLCGQRMGNDYDKLLVMHKIVVKHSLVSA